VGALTSCNPTDLHGLIRDIFTLLLFGAWRSYEFGGDIEESRLVLKITNPINNVKCSRMAWLVQLYGRIFFQRRWHFNSDSLNKRHLQEVRAGGELSQNVFRHSPPSAIVHSRRRDSERKQTKPRVATADSKEWTKRAVSSVYSLHSRRTLTCIQTSDTPATVHASRDRCKISF
jgi:hypothetical protein